MCITTTWVSKLTLIRTSEVPFMTIKNLRAISTMILKVHHTSFMTMENRVTLETAFGLSESFMGWIRDEIFLIFSN
ncbi:hypothetical protein IX299_000980 [Porphyromonas levii]|nr:hypothetical protein [Porphyromonas levii]